MTQRRILTSLVSGAVLILALASFTPAHAQTSDAGLFRMQMPYSVYQPGSVAYICQDGASGNPCSPLALIYSDRALSQPISQPITLGPNSIIEFYASANTWYVLQQFNPSVGWSSQPIFVSGIPPTSTPIVPSSFVLSPNGFSFGTVAAGKTVTQTITATNQTASAVNVYSVYIPPAGPVTGSCIMSSGACSAQSFAAPFAVIPICTCSWTGTGTLAGTLKCPATATAVTPASTSGTDTATVAYTCTAPQDQWQIQADSCSGQAIPPSGSCSVTVAFTSSAIGQSNANIVFVDNGSGPNTVSANATGSATVTLQAVNVLPANPSQTLPFTLQMSAIGTFSDGSTSSLPNSALTWSSGTPATATIDTNGILTGVAAGTSTITATDGAVSGSTTLTVSAAGTVAVTISPTSATVALNALQQFTASVTGSSNTAVTWSASCGSIINTGLYTAPSSATTCAVTATSVADPTKSATAPVTVSNSPSVQPALVQKAANSSSSSLTTISQAFTNPNTANDAIVVLIGSADTTSTVSSVTDTNNNTYVLAGARTTSGTSIQQSLYYALNVVGGANTVKVNFSGTATHPDLRIAEYKNVTGFDVANQASGSSTSASVSLTTTKSNEIVVGGVRTIQNVTGATGGYVNELTTSGGDNLMDLVIATAGATTPGATLSPSGAWSINALAFTGQTSAGTGGSNTTYSESSQQPVSMIPYAGNINSLLNKQLPSAGNGGPVSHLYSGSAAAVTGLLANSPNFPIGAYAGELTTQSDAFYYGLANQADMGTFVSAQNAPINVSFWAPQNFAIGASAWDEQVIVWDQSQGIAWECTNSCTGSTTANYCGNQPNNEFGAGGSTLGSGTAITLKNCAAEQPFGSTPDIDWGWGANTTYASGSYALGGQIFPGFAAWAGMTRHAELINGQINHALILGYSCSDDNLAEGGSVFPATYKLQNSTTCPTAAEAGMLLFTDYTDAQIASMLSANKINHIQATILTAMSHFGGYLLVTDGNPSGSTGQLKVADDGVESDEAMNLLAGYPAACDTSSSSYTTGQNCATTIDPNFYNWWFAQTGNSFVENVFANIPSVGCGGIACHLHVADPCVSYGMSGAPTIGKRSALNAPTSECASSVVVHVVGSGSITAFIGSNPTATENSNLVCDTTPAGDQWCNVQADDGTSYELQATPASGHTFTGWSGACTGTGNCQVGSLNGANGVVFTTATFN